VKLCCDEPRNPPKSVKSVRETNYPGKRTGHKPPKREQDRLLKEYGYCCAYCDVPFGMELRRIDYKQNRKRYIKTKVCWDHATPYSYTKSHKLPFVPSCQVCNGIKSNKVFNDFKEAREYISERRNKRYEVY